MLEAEHHLCPPCLVNLGECCIDGSGLFVGYAVFPVKYNFYCVCVLSSVATNLWTRLGSAPKVPEKVPEKPEKSAAPPEEDDSVLQRAWGALIKEKEQSRQKKSRLDHLPSLQIEISRESSSGSDTES